jgi:hypothetical protein
MAVPSNLKLKGTELTACLQSLIEYTVNISLSGEISYMYTNDTLVVFLIKWVQIKYDTPIKKKDSTECK